ncbi:MAG: NifU family protein [Acidimicrobiales bacterium]
MLRSKVEEVIEVVRPIIQADHGDVVLHDVDEASGVVTVELVGACVTCPASSQTLKAGLERIMKDRVPGVTEVRNIGQVLDTADIGALSSSGSATGGGGASTVSGHPEASPLRPGAAAAPVPARPPVRETPVSL